MKLKDWLFITDGRVTDGSEFSFDCYGDRAYTMSYWNGFHREAEASTSVVYDRDTFEVYETDVYNGANNKAYVWRDPRWADLFKAELTAKNCNFASDFPEIELEVAEDFTEKATAILNGEEYDSRIKIPLDLNKDQMFALMVAAHEGDITLNELIDVVLRQAIDQHLDRAKPEDTKPSSVNAAWPFPLSVNQMKSQVTWTSDAEDFIGMWNTIKDLEVVFTDYGQFSGGVARTYDAPVATYEVIWYDGDTDKLPDEIVRTIKDVE